MNMVRMRRRIEITRYNSFVLRAMSVLFVVGGLVPVILASHP